MSRKGAEPKTHDYTVRTWGHDFTITSVIDGGQKLRMCGWGRGIEDGDFLVLPNKLETTRYRAENVSCFADPPDMWAMDACFAHRTQAAA